MNMRKLLLLCAIAVPMWVTAEPVKMNKEVVCDEATKLISQFISDKNEQPIFVGITTGSVLVVLVNPATQAWTVIQTNSKIACVLEVGQEFRYREPKIELDPEKLVSN
jgi:hypothetical protein